MASAQGSGAYNPQSPPGANISDPPPTNREVIGESPPPNPDRPDGNPRRQRYYEGVGGSGDSDGSGGMALPRRTPGFPPPVQRPRRVAPLHAAWLHGNRDYVIYVECQQDAVVLYPSQRRFPLSALGPEPGENNPLAQAVRLMIQHRQALLRPGEPPYRPEVRHLIWPNGVLAFHVAYPALEFLHVPQKQQRLNWDDDVEAIVTEP